MNGQGSNQQDEAVELSPRPGGSVSDPTVKPAPAATPSATVQPMASTTKATGKDAQPARAAPARPAPASSQRPKAKDRSNFEL